jgi:quercetin dioxygenase-like cupin family protein
MSGMDVIRWNKPKKPTADELRIRLRNEGLECGLFTDKPGTKFGRHKHDFDDFIVIVSGKMKLGIDGHEWVLKPGDRLDLPANTPHWAEVMGKEPVLYFSAEK